MRKLIMFFAGLILMLLTFAALYFAGAIYDAGEKHTVDTYFFQTNGQSGMRLGVPARPEDLGDAKLRDMLIRKYVHEYFYAIPDKENIASRTLSTGTIARMSNPAVFEQWLDTQATVIEELANAGAMRTVDVIGEITKPADSDFWIVEYELKTWYTPNDMNAIPEITRGVMYITVYPDSGYTKIRNSVDLGTALESGRDPATVFNFGVIQVEVP